MANDETPSPLVTHYIQGHTIQQRRDDGYINGTAMCKAAGKEWSNYWQNKGQRHSCLSMKLSKAAETQRMSHRGFQSLCHIRVRTVQLPPTSL